jgi:hypothetical protein
MARNLFFAARPKCGTGSDEGIGRRDPGASVCAEIARFCEDEESRRRNGGKLPMAVASYVVLAN